jgi:hypothetical protein
MDLPGELGQSVLKYEIHIINWIYLVVVTLP